MAMGAYRLFVGRSDRLYCLVCPLLDLFLNPGLCDRSGGSDIHNNDIISLQTTYRPHRGLNSYMEILKHSNRQEVICML